LKAERCHVLRPAQRGLVLLLPHCRNRDHRGRVPIRGSRATPEKMEIS
jgi:hypothetical protein